MAATVAEARALPEIAKPDVRADGQRFRPLCVRRADGSVMLFVDTDGRPMKVVRAGDGEAKVPFNIYDGWGE